MYRIEYFKGRGKQPWRSRIVSAQNGQTIWSSEGYTSKASCIATIQNFAKWSLNHGFHEADIVEIK